jgi:hypothetical protein
MTDAPMPDVPTTHAHMTDVPMTDAPMIDAPMPDTPTPDVNQSAAQHSAPVPLPVPVPVPVTDASATTATAANTPAPATPQAPPPGHRSTLSSTWTVLLLGVALALAAVNPAHSASRGPAGWLLIVAAVAAAIWAAPAVTRRPASDSIQWISRLIRHRNTTFAVACTVLAASSDPATWLMTVDTALLLAYLLAVDAFAAGPIGAGQLRDGIAPLAAAAASAVVLLGAQAPVNPGAVWGRIVAALAVAAAASAAGAALWSRQTRTQISKRIRRVRFDWRRIRNKPRHL